MALDIAALKAKIAAKKAAETKEKENEIQVKDSGTDIAVVSSGNITNSSNTSSTEVTVPSTSAVNNVAVAVAAPVRVGTALTSELDHLDFLAKMNKLADAIHTAHPTMPVLLMQIHKQLRADPELVTTLDEDAIVIIVKGLQIQTKTELVSVVVKESKSKAKKQAITMDML